MLIITTISLLLISALSYNYFSNKFEAQAKSNADYTLKIASKSFNTKFNAILSTSSRLLANKKMNTMVRHIESNIQSEYINDYVALDSDFTLLIQSNDFISSAFIIDKHQHFYSTADIGLKYDPSNYFGWDLSTVDGISFLPLRKSPISRDTDVIPLIIPIYYETRMDSTFVSDSIERSTAVLIILLDVAKMNQYLAQVNNNSGAVLFLANGDGLPLSLKVDSSAYRIVNNLSITNQLQNIVNARSFTEKNEQGTYLVTSYDIGMQELKLVSIVSRTDLLSGLTSIKTFIIISWLLSTFVAAVLSVILSKLITKPINALVNIVQNIQDGRYNEKIQSDYYDEVGILNHSINEMYDTIQQQITVIKEEVQAKAKAEIDLLTYQINPHFLYNTLECIHLEILNSHSMEAASMVESLGQFLRIGLNQGNNLIPIQQELTHAKQYINLMNHMSNYKIAFRGYIDPNLENYRLLKFIIQPLFENCIKHGFQINGAKQNIFSPFIEVKVTTDHEQIVIEVTDNGIGINIEKAKEALYQIHPSPTTAHIGLNNIYRRLHVYYGESVDIQFFSIPFHQNSILITLPYFSNDR